VCFSLLVSYFKQILTLNSFVGGDADQDDVHYCLDPLSIYFEEVPCRHEDSLQDAKVVPKSSKIYFSSRVLLLPFIEIRQANQEDHDDLADVFNN
jgi:hypothetical protein